MIIELHQTGFRHAWHRATASANRSYLPTPREPIVLTHLRRQYHIYDEGTQVFNLDAGGLAPSGSDWLQVQIDHHAKTWQFRYNGDTLWYNEPFPYDNRWHIRTVRVMVESGRFRNDWQSVALGRLRWRIVEPIYRDPADVALEGITMLLATRPDDEALRQLRREVLLSRLGG